MVVDPIDHMEEAWHLDGNPFPAEAIHSGTQPYSPAVFDEEAQEFRRKLIRGSILGSCNVGFLWSQGAQADTGFGKTTLMQEITKEINSDLGVDTLTRARVRPDRRIPIAAAFSNLNTLNATGLYPVLFNAVIDLAQPSGDSSAVFDKARARLTRRGHALLKFWGLMSPRKSLVRLTTRGSAYAERVARFDPNWSRRSLPVALQRWAPFCSMFLLQCA